jgi:hypothetical protein
MRPRDEIARSSRRLQRVRDGLVDWIGGAVAMIALAIAGRLLGDGPDPDRPM